jgi:putative multiple sugar transport system substrate-binding protein
MTVVAPVGAATVGAAWRAKIGSAGANGTATIQAYTTGSGSLALRLARLTAATYLPVTLSKGTCAYVGSPLIAFPAIRTTSSGTAARTSSLTVAQVTKIKAATTGTGRIAMRVGSSTTGGVRCGVFTLIYAPIGIVLPSNWVQDQARFQDALKTAGYGARILLSRDSATERADVEALISQGIKVLILCPQDGAAAAAAADEARAAGVRVISYGRLVLDTASVDYLSDGFDGVAVGAAQAQYLIDRAGATKGNNLYLYAGAASDNNTFLFLEGAWEKLQPRIADGTFVIRNSSLAVALQGKATLTRGQEGRIIGQVTTNWDVNTARYLAQSNLMAAQAADKGTVFLLAPNDGTARAIADAFAADRDVTKSWVTGQDADKASVQYIIDGRQGMTVFKDPRTRVKDALAAAVAFLRGGTPAATTTYNNGTIDVPSNSIDFVTVTRDNIQSALIDTGYYRVGDFTGSWPGKP